MATSPDSPVATTEHSRLSVGKLVKLAIALLILAALVFVGLHYWRQAQLYVTTDNAYVNANRVQIAAQVSGPITAIHVRDQQTVKQGDLLFEIDARPYEFAMEVAASQLALARQNNSQEAAAVAAASAQVTQRLAELRNAQSNEQRVRDLIERNLISKQAAEQTLTQAETAAAGVQAAEASLEQARSMLGEVGAKNAAVRGAAANLSQASLDLEHTKVHAPSSGLIANFGLRPGSMVQKEVPLFTIIGDEEYWVDANFKETELDTVHPGQTATVIVDMYKRNPFEGEVESLSGGSGAAFSLLPAQNATGNWVKVTQRVPVRVRITNPDPNFPLRVGTTATVRIRIGEK